MYRGSSSLPPALSALLMRRNYADGGAVMPPSAPPAGITGAPAPGQPPTGGGIQMQLGPLNAEVQRVTQANPQIVAQMQQVIRHALESGSLTMDQLNLAIELAKAVAQNHELYPRLRQLAIQKGLATEEELPQQYDQGVVFGMLVAAQAIQQGDAAPNVPVAGQNASARMADGGHVSQSASPSNDKSGRADDIPIKVSGGEYVIPKHVVSAKGTEFFDRMLEQYDPNNPESKVNKQG